MKKSTVIGALQSMIMPLNLPVFGLTPKKVLSLGLLVLVSLITVVWPLNVNAQSIDEVDITRKRLETTFTQTFHDEFNQVITSAKIYLEGLPKAARQPAAVLDLDETLMDNRAYFLRYGYFDPQLWEVWVFEEEAPALPETLAFYHWLKDRGYGVFFVTGRKQAWKQATVDNLRRYGITDMDGIYFKPNQYDKNSAQDFKTAARKDIERQGYQVQLILGDQVSDLRGGVGKGFKLPNPIYTIP